MTGVEPPLPRLGVEPPLPRQGAEPPPSRQGAEPPPLSRAEAEALAAFVAASPAAGWTRTPLAGDASSRRYERLTAPDGRSAVLMDARAEPAPVAAFLRIAAHLRRLGLAAPAILAQGEGLLLLEDLGPETLAARLDARPGQAAELYAAAVDLLPRLAAAPPPEGLVRFTPLRLAGLLAPLWEHYVPAMPPGAAALLVARLQEAVERAAPEPDTLCLRDLHAGNLIWREGRAGTDRLGLLDFQDAVLAPAEYDLASLLRDARRELAPELHAALLTRFAAATGRAEARVAAAAAALGLARNLRILGVFARLAARGRPAYLGLLPVARRQVDADLAHPTLAALAPLVAAFVPPPERRGA